MRESFPAIPAIIGIAAAKPTEISQPEAPRGAIANIFPRNGINIQPPRQSRDIRTEKIRNGLEKYGTEKRVFSSLLHSKT